MSALLEVRGLRRSFGGLMAVRGLDFDVPKGSIVGLIGPNGSGKTTTLNLITGELTPDSGSVKLDGRDITGLPPFRVNRARVARTFQLVRVLPGMTTRENVMLGRLFGAEPGRMAESRGEVEQLLELVDLGGRAHLMAGQLTYIDQKRIELARALAARPKLLLLDEWLAGLNPSELLTGIELIGRIRDEGVTIIMIEHVMEAIRALCDKVVVMSAGELLAEGTSEAVLSDPRVMSVYLGESHVEA